MKTLYLVRHAKSSWKDMSLADFDRPLKKRGLRDAPFMARLLAKQGDMPELMVSSPANRALTTAKIFCAEMGYSLDNLQQMKSIYEAGVMDLLNIVKNINIKISSAMLFGHNPGLTGFSNYISDTRIDNIPTCGIVKLELDTSWSSLGENSCRLAWFEYPKKYF